jgi:peptide/nickel transport system substrate-binding protein
MNSMNRTDHAVIGGLVLALALIALAMGLPSLVPTAATPSAVPTLTPLDPYREGAIGRPVSVNPLAARSQVDRDLVALSFSGLVRLGADGEFVPDLASRWTTSGDGKVWSFTIRPDARWHDGEPVTAADVLYTVSVLRDPAYTGPGAGSWLEVAAEALDGHTVRFTLATPIAGFLQLASQPIAPAHLLGTVPIESLADDEFGQVPVGSGSFKIVELDADHAVLEPAASAAEPATEPDPSASAAAGPPSDALATAAPTKRPAIPMPQLTRLEFRFFDDPTALAAAFGRGELDAASGLSQREAGELAANADARMLRYPGTTLTSILLNLRPDHLELRDPAVRAALLGAIDREAIIAEAFGGLASIADAPIPPTSWAFDAAASPPIKLDAKAAAKALEKAGWKKVDKQWRPAGATTVYTIQLVRPDAEMSPSLRVAAERVAADWKALGFAVEVVEAEPGSLLSDYLETGEFTAAALDVSIGHDPDLYPLLASSQTQTGGLNVIGLQDAALDELLKAARRPGTPEARRAAYTALQTQLTASRYVLPIAFADEVVVVRNEVSGVVVQPVSDPSDRFWDVLTWRLASDR